MKRHLIVKYVIGMLGVVLGINTGAMAAEGSVDLRDLRGIVAAKENAYDQQAARILNRYIERMFQVDLPINPEGVGRAGTHRDVILVGKQAARAAGAIGRQALEQVKHDGFVIKVGNGRIIVAGYEGRGTVYGAYALLESWGCRFYAPSVEVVPEKHATVVESLHISDKPFFEYRGGRRWPGRTSSFALGDPREALNPELFDSESGSNLWLDHTAGYLVPKAIYYDDHPEYYALRRSGNRIPQSTSDARLFLCSTNPDVRRIAVRRTRGWMRRQPDRRYFMISVGDGLDWCQCETCVRSDRSHGNYSDRLLEFVNFVARRVRDEFPDKVLFTLGYMGSEYAPVEVRPAENVIVLYCPYFGIGRSMAHPLTHEVNSVAREQLEGWLDVAPENTGIYDYNLRYVPSWNAMAQKLKWYRDQGIRAVWRLGRPTCFRDMFNYITEKLMWDPSLDPQTLKREFVSAYYGDAAPHIMTYLSRVEDRVASGYPRMIYEASMPPDYYSVAFVNESIRLLDRALAAAGDDTAVRKRVEKEKELFCQDYWRAVNLVNDGVDGRGIVRQAPSAHQREQALALFQAHLRHRLREGVAPSALRKPLVRFAGLELDSAADIESIVRRFVVEPHQVVSAFKRPPTKPTPAERMDNGVRLPASAFTGGFGPMRYSWYCEPREAVIIGTAASPRSSVLTATFRLANEPTGDAVLRMEGQDADKDTPPAAQIAIRINGVNVFEGACGFAKHGWSWRDIAIEPGVLRRGANTIQIENVTEGRRMDHYWFALSEAQLIVR